MEGQEGLGLLRSWGTDFKRLVPLSALSLGKGFPITAPYSDHEPCQHVPASFPEEQRLTAGWGGRKKA